jgi:hypothetical protein
MEHAIFAGEEVQHAIFSWPDNHSDGILMVSYFFHVRAFLGADEEVLPAAEADFSDAAPASTLRCTGKKNVSSMATSTPKKNFYAHKQNLTRTLKRTLKREQKKAYEGPCTNARTHKHTQTHAHAHTHNHTHKYKQTQNIKIHMNTITLALFALPASSASSSFSMSLTSCLNRFSSSLGVRDLMNQSKRKFHDRRTCKLICIYYMNNIFRL